MSPDTEPNSFLLCHREQRVTVSPHQESTARDPPLKTQRARGSWSTTESTVFTQSTKLSINPPFGDFLCLSVVVSFLTPPQYLICIFC